MFYLIPVFMTEPLKTLCVDNICAYHDKYGRWVVEMHDSYYKQSYLVKMTNSGASF